MVIGLQSTGGLPTLLHTGGCLISVSQETAAISPCLACSSCPLRWHRHVPPASAAAQLAGASVPEACDRPHASRLSPALCRALLVGLYAGEAAADALKLEPGQVCGFVSTTRELLSRFVMTHLPVQYDAGPNSSMPGICCSRAGPVMWCSPEACEVRLLQLQLAWSAGASSMSPGTAHMRVKAGAGKDSDSDRLEGVHLSSSASQICRCMRRHTPPVGLHQLSCSQPASKTACSYGNMSALTCRGKAGAGWEAESRVPAAAG